MNLDKPVHSIGDLARLTGISVAALRAWEMRYTFPIPQRLPSGHRRYTERDVAALRQVSRDRQAGTSLATALALARQHAAAPRSSIMATMRHALPELTPVEVSKRTLMMMSRAIEDEIVVRALQPVLVGAFQDRHYLRQSSERWHDLASTSLATLVFGAPAGEHRGETWEIPIDAESPLRREWAVICDSPNFSVGLVATERLAAGNRSQRRRRFELLWTVEPAVVREVVRTAAALADSIHPGLHDVVANRLEAPASDVHDAARTATVLTNRMIGNLDTL